VSPRAMNRPGFAIPTALLVSLVLLVMLTASFSLVSSERKVVDDGRAELDAEAIAEAGLEQFLANRRSFGFTGIPAVSESTRVVMGHGYADVVLTQLRPQVGSLPPLYLVKSHGVRTVKQVANAPDAERTVAEYAKWKNGTIATNAAFTSLTGIQKYGGAGTISGVDACGGPSAAGVAVPTPPGYSQDGGALIPDGSPNILSLGTQQQAIDGTNMDWQGVVNGTSFTPDVSLPAQSWPDFQNPNSYPTIKVTGNYALPTSGRGLLIVTGDLTINGALHWDGVILVGGTLIANGNDVVDGAVMSGLNELLGQSVPVQAIGNGDKTFQYDACKIANAMSAFGALVPFTNAWVDDWATF
jgi:hypothetical protein